MKKIKVLAIAGVFTASLAATAFAEMADVKIGGEIRVRDEIRNNYDDFDKGASDQADVVSQRTRINVDAKVNETTKAYLSLQDTRNWGAEATTANTAAAGSEAVDVSQAYVQLDKLFDQPLSLKLGRQVLSYGDQRLIGGFEWSDNARRFDALKLVYNTDAVSVDLFLATVEDSETIKTAVQTSDMKEGRFNGIYVTAKTIPMNTLDIYGLQKKGDAANGENIMTYGLRLNGGVAGADWTAEYAIQNGDTDTATSKDASMYAVKAGYSLPEVMGMRIGAEIVNATGDDGSSSDDEAFDNLYPTNHPLYGVSDVLEYYNAGNALSNLNAWSINVGAKPVEGLRLLAEYWNFEDNEPGDKLGTEVNLQAWYAINANVDLHAFYAQFAPETGDDATDMVVQLAVKF